MMELSGVKLYGVDLYGVELSRVELSRMELRLGKTGSMWGGRDSRAGERPWEAGTGRAGGRRGGRGGGGEESRGGSGGRSGADTTVPWRGLGGSGGGFDVGGMEDDGGQGRMTVILTGSSRYSSSRGEPVW